MTLRITASDLLDMEADIGMGAEVTVTTDIFSFYFTATVWSEVNKEVLSITHALSCRQAFYLNDEVKILPEIAYQLREKIQKELDQGSE